VITSTATVTMRVTTVKAREREGRAGIMDKRKPGISPGFPAIGPRAIVYTLAIDTKTIAAIVGHLSS
jgi:hypothetical protein